MSCDGGGGEPPAEDIAVMVQGVTLEYMERVASGDQIMAAVGSWLFLIGTAPEYIYLLSTVEPLLTHTPRWTARAMGYEGLWANRGMVKNRF